MQTPFFSIIIPTRNRATTLYGTIKTCVEQDFAKHGIDSYEIVVSDNCSEDDIKGVLAKFESNKVQYQRSDHYLSMADSWEFALSKARGRYVGFVCSDDGYVLNALSDIHNIVTKTGAQAISFQHANYFWPNYFDPNLRNKLLIPQYVFREGFHSSIKLVEESLYTLQYGRLPCFLNSFCSMDVIKRIQEKGSRVFGSYCPDVYSGFVVASNISEIYVVNRMLGIGGASADSNGAAFREDPLGLKAQEHITSYKEERISDGLVDFPFAATIVVDAMLKALVTSGREDGLIGINIMRYLMNCYREGLLIHDGASRKKGLESIRNYLRNRECGTNSVALIRLELKRLQWLFQEALPNPILRFLQLCAYRLGLGTGRLWPESLGQEQTNIENVYDAARFFTGRQS